MINNYEELIECIRRIQSQDVKTAETQLLNSVNQPNFLNMMYQAIKGTQQKQWLSMIAATFLNRIFYDKQQIISNQIINQTLINILINPSISNLNKRCFQRSIIAILEKAQEKQLQNWVSLTLQLLQSKLLWDTVYLMIACFAVAQVNKKYLQLLIQNTFIKTLNFITICHQQANLLNEQIKTWIVVFDKLLIHKQHNKSLLQMICSSQSLLNLIDKIYAFQAQEEIFLCINAELFQLNLLKYQASDLNKRMLVYAETNINQMKTVFLHLSNNIGHISRSLIGVAANRQIIQQCQCEDLVTCFISLFTLHYKNNTVFFSNQWHKILTMIVLPFLKAGDEQKYMFEQQTNQFNMLAQDCCDKQTYGILKTESAKLLQTICDNTPQSMEFILEICLNSIKINLGFINNENNNNNAQNIIQFETAFLILSIFSYNIGKYGNFLTQLKIILCDERLLKLPSFEISRIYLFLAYNYNEVYHNLQQGQHWIKLALNNNSSSSHHHKTTIYCGLDFLSNLVDQYFSQEFFIILYKKLMEFNAPSILWQILDKLLKSHLMKINQNLMCGLINIVFQRISKEFQIILKDYQNSTNNNKNNNYNTLDLVNAYYLLLKIMKQHEYIDKKFTLQNLIFQITNVYQQSCKLSIDDEIIKIMNEFIEISQQINPNIYKFGCKFIKQFSQDGYHQKTYMIFINALIMKGIFQQIEFIWNTIYSGIIYHLMYLGQNLKQANRKIIICNLLILIQNFITIHGNQMNQNKIYETSCICLRLIPQQLNQKIYNKILIAKSLNLLLICHMYQKTQNIYDYIFKYLHNKIFLNYDCKVIILCLSKIIFQENNIQIITAILTIMLKIITYNKEEKDKNKIKKSKFKSISINDFQILLKKINTPFKSLVSLEDKVLEVLMSMKQANLQSYQTVIKNLNDDCRSQLARITKAQVVVAGKTRVIHRVIGIKEGQSEQNVENNQEIDDTYLKRERVINKKKNKK